MKKRYVIAALAISLGLSACSNNGEVEEQPQDEPQEEVQDQPQEEGQPEDAGSEEEQDATSEEGPSISFGAEEELQEEIASQPGIVDVMVQVEEGSANRINADIEINDEQELSPEEVAETYAELIKEKYPDHAVDIIIIQDGQMLTQAQFE